MIEWIRSNQRTLLFAIPLLLVCLLLFNPFKNASTEIPSKTLTPLIPTQESATPPPIEEPIKPIVSIMQVDIKGQVLFPGVYKVNEGDRVIDLIELAGGASEGAEMTSVNLSQKLHDEMVIYIPSFGEVIPETLNTTNSPEGESNSGKINLNTADLTALQEIPGIGPAKAQAIIDFRDTVGKFKSIEEIKNISGIGDKTFDKMKELIEVK